MNKRRVVVTGLGVVSSIGIGKEEFWKNLIAGKSGISEVTSFDTFDYDTRIGGEIKNFNPENYLEKRRIKGWGRATQLAMTATKEAINDAKLDLWKYGNERIGVLIGTTMGEGQILEKIDSDWIKFDETKIARDLIALYPGSNLAENISFKFGLKGPSWTIPTACSAGNYSIGFAFDKIKSSKNRIMVVGGTDSFSRVAFVGFNRLYATAKEKCSPFDKNRNGMVVGEGAGILILEDLELAIERGANVYAEVLGYGLSCGAHHMTVPSCTGIAMAIKRALKEADVAPHLVNYISAHGTGTPSNDKAECQAIKEVFGDDYRCIAISAIKSMLGHTMGAASAIEALTCCLAITNNIIPPTINYKTPDPECDIDCVPNEARRLKVKIALNNSLAFGGNNACLVFGKHFG